jgi:hypothetical protein
MLQGTAGSRNIFLVLLSWPAEDHGLGGETWLTASRRNCTNKECTTSPSSFAGTADGAFQALDWLIYGNVSLGGAYDSNVWASPNQQSAFGPRFQPSIVALRDTGIQRTIVYGVGDIRYYPELGRTDVVNTTAGVAHVWEIQRDLIFRTQFEATRGLQDSNLISTVNVPGPQFTQPIRYTSLFGSTSIEKSFGPFFTAIGGSVTGNFYEDTKDSLGIVINESFQNGTRATLNGRFGYNISPIVYTFVEPQFTIDWERGGALGLTIELEIANNGTQVRGGRAWIERAVSVGRLLAEVQRIKAEGDYAAAKQLFEKHGVHFDPKLRDEVLQRVMKLNLPAYSGFVMPKLEAVTDNTGAITDVRISYPQDLTTQMLEYSGHGRAVQSQTP